MPAFSDSELSKIWERAKIAAPDITLHDIQGLSETYDYLVYDNDYPPFTGTTPGAPLGSSGWARTFEEMISISGLTRAKVAAFMVAMKEFIDKTMPQDSWLDYLKAGASGVEEGVSSGVSKAGDLVKGAVSSAGGFVTGVENTAAKVRDALGSVKTVYLVTIGAVILLYLGPKLLHILEKRKANA